MKHAFFLLAVFLYLSTTAQQNEYQTTNELPAYHPVKFESLKKFKSPEQFYDIGGVKGLHTFTLTQPATTFNFKPLQNYLSEDTRYFRLGKKRKNGHNFPVDY